MPPKCSICTHPDRAKIDKAILAGESNRRIATQYGVSESAIRRHTKNGHIPDKLSKAAEKKEITQADQLLKVMEGLLSECIRTIKSAQGYDENLKLRAIKEARDTARVLLDVQGKLPPDTVVNVTVIENQWNDFRNVILNTMCPECRAAVVKKLKEMSDRS